MRIASLELKQIGPFEEAVFEFPKPSGQGELFLFEGPNGSGKTTVAVAIAMSLGPIVEKAGFDEKTYDIEPFYWGRRIRTEDGRSILTIEDNSGRMITEITRRQFSTSFPGHPDALIQEMGRYNKVRMGEGGTVNWSAYTFSSHQKTPKMSSNGPAQLRTNPLRYSLHFGHYAYRGALGAGPPLGQLLTNLDYERVRAIAYSRQSSKDNNNRQQMENASVSYEKAISRIQDAFSRVLDRKVEFRFELGTSAPKMLFDGEETPVELLGEGMRSTVAWLSDFILQLESTPWERKDISPFDQNFWLILDEIDQSLHPKMQMRILPVLRSLFPNACIYATTHSPFVVGSVGEGYVFSLDPNPQTHRVTGKQSAMALRPGQSLKWIVSKVFDTPSTFLDEATIQALEVHQQSVERLSRKLEIDWDNFLKTREWLFNLNDEVKTVVAMREISVEPIIEQHIKDSAK